MKQYLLIIMILLAPTLLYGNDDWERFDIAQHKTFFRVAYGLVWMQEEELNSQYGRGQSVMADIFLYNIRLQNWSKLRQEIEFYTRLTGRRYELDESDAVSRGMYRDSRLDILSLDLGMRYTIGRFFFSTLWQIYVLAAPRAVSCAEYATDDEGRNVGKNYYAIGAVGGAGLEISVFSFTGLFIEYNYGYTPVGEDKKNIEGHQIFAGLTYRTISGW